MEGLGDLEDWNNQPTERLWDSPTESVEHGSEPRHDQQPPNVRREANSEAVSTTKTPASERPLPASESEPPLQQTAANFREAGRRFNRNIILA